MLTRKIGERFMIGDDTEVIVLGIKSNQVRLGVVAPKNIAVHREELYRKIQLKNATKNATKNHNR